MAGQINFLSLNVGMSASLAGLVTLISAHQLDIIFLQEVRLTKEQLDILLGSIGFVASVNIDPSQPTKPGTALVWKKNLQVKDVFSVVLCRAQVAVLGPYMLLNVYAPSGSEKRHERAEFFGQDIFRALRLNPNALWVIGGDFNCVLKAMDVEGGMGFKQKFSHELKDLVRSCDLVDVFRQEFPRQEEFSFFRAGKAPSRLDRFYVSRKLASELVAGSCHVASLSDHCGIKFGVKMLVDLMSLPKTQRKTYWKLNTSILNDEEFLPHFASFWRRISVSQNSFSDVAEWWDKLAKPEIRDFCIGFSVNRKFKRDHTKRFLLSYLKLALVKKNWGEVARVKEELDTMLKADAMGVVVRSRFSQNSEDEKASLFHAAREAKNDKNNINSLKIEGVNVNDQGKIEEEVLKFFGALFNGHHDVNLVDTGEPFIPNNRYLGEFLDGLGKLSDYDRDKLHVDICTEELAEVIEKCDNNKSPGLDGIPYEFYKTVWPVIGEVFQEVLQCQLDRIRIIDSDTIGATRLASKVSGIPQVDELRPITLLNTDYKILTKIFVMRMLPILIYIIRSGQLCTVGNKNILFGVNNILSSLLYIKQQKLGACLISLDFFKAFDRVMVDFLILVMRKMNFSEKFCKWVKMLHVGAKTKFILKFLTEAISVSFSIRQGDPLAMILYIIYIEPLLLYLERFAVGLKIAGNIPQCIEAYCDDVNILTSNMADFMLVDSAIKKFESISGAILSRAKKCKVIGFGTWKDKVDWPLNYIKTVKEIKVFGIFVMDAYRSMIKRNWDYRFEKFENAVKSWSPRILETLSQRIEVLRIFALSRVFYVASILPIRVTMVKKFEKIMGKFLWNDSGKVLRVSLAELKNKIELGGLGMPCLLSMSKSLLLSQLLRLLKSGDMKTMKHIGYWMGDLLGDLVVGLDGGAHAQVVPEYFATIADVLVEAKASELVSGSNWKTLKCQGIYREYAKHFPVPKVEIEAGVSFKTVWRRLASPVLSVVARDVLFLLLHNKLPVRERLFRIGLAVDPYCQSCPGAVICDLEHFFCSCTRVSNVWGWVRARLMGMLEIGYVHLSNWELLNLLSPNSKSDKETVWLIGTYVARTWEDIFVRGKAWLRAEQFFGFLRFKYRADQLGSRLPLGFISGLFL